MITMKHFLQLYLILQFSTVLAEVPTLKSIQPFYIFQTKNVSTLSSNQTIIHIQMDVPGANEAPAYFKTPVYCSINGIMQTHFLDSTNTVTWVLKPGLHVFKLWAGPGYSEIITDSIRLLPQTENFAVAHFGRPETMISVDKPVIYFHVSKAQEFSLTVEPTAPFTFTYPRYQNDWHGTAFPDGHLLVSGMKIPYLFWESKQSYHFQKNGNGIHIQRDSIIQYLEQQLTRFQFTIAEKTDFITYWGPKMMRYPSVFVQWYLDDECATFAKIKCTPSHSIHRFYMAFSEWNPTFQSAIRPLNLKTPFLPTSDYIIEWGGFEFPSGQTTHQ